MEQIMRKGLVFFDAFDFILNEISTGAIRLRSDFFTTLHQGYATTFQISNLAHNNTVTFVWLDEFNNEFEFVVKYRTSGITGTPEAVFRRVFVEGLNELFDYHVGIDIVTNSSNDFTITVNYHGQKINLISITTAATANIISTTDYVEGMGNLYVTNGYNLSDRQEKSFLVDFDHLFKIVSNLFDLSYAFEIDAGQTYLRIEPISYFLENPDIVNIGAVDVTSMMYEKDRIAKGVMIGKEENIPVIDFANLNCNNYIDRKVSSKVHTKGAEIGRQILMTEDFGEELFLVEMDPNAINQPLVYKRTDTFSGSLFYITSYNQIIDGAFFFNGAYLFPGNRNLLRYHIFFMPDKLILPIYRREKETDVALVETVLSPYTGADMQFLTIQDFQALLSFAQYQNIDGYSLIEFESKGEQKFGYILNMKYKAKTGLTDFSLLVQ